MPWLLLDRPGFRRTGNSGQHVWMYTSVVLLGAAVAERAGAVAERAGAVAEGAVLLLLLLTRGQCCGRESSAVAETAVLWPRQQCCGREGNAMAETAVLWPRG